MFYYRCCTTSQAMHGWTQGCHTKQVKVPQIVTNGNKILALTKSLTKSCTKSCTNYKLTINWDNNFA
jgi:hypothetical protein